MGKAYANKKKLNDRPEGDFYQTPPALTQELIATGELDNIHKILEPACGELAIVNELKNIGKEVTAKDLKYGNDFLSDDYSAESFDAIITNPPFSLWDEFVNKAKSINCKKIIFIGRTNYFGSHSRNINGIWDHLSKVYIFDRQVAYDRELRKDNKLECGCLITGWFVWDLDYTGDPVIKIIDVQKHIASKKCKK